MQKSINILAVLDDFTFTALSLEADVNLISYQHWFYHFFPGKIDFVLVESAWLGQNRKWQYHIADYPEHPRRNNDKVKALIQWAKKHQIPTIFWNKEDPYHFNQFIDSARLFDFIFTTDHASISKYQSLCPDVKVNYLNFPFQPKIHYPAPITQTISRSSLFMGSYLHHMFPERREWQDILFQAAAPHGLCIVNRHDDKKDKNYKFPTTLKAEYLHSVPYRETGHIMRKFQQIINVNSITSSPTMLSRRVVEGMACGRLVISNPSLALQNLFPDLCEVVETQEQADELFTQLSYGLNHQQNEKIRYACDHVFTHYTVKQWLKDILNSCQIDHPYLYA